MLALHIEDFKLDEQSIDHIRQEVGISPDKAAQLLKDLGCDVVHTSTDRIRVGHVAELLQKETDPPRQLKDCFPPLGLNQKKGKRRRAMETSAGTHHLG